MTIPPDDETRESRAPFGIGRQVGRQHFHRHRAVEPRVARFVDLAHAPGPAGGEDFIRPESSAGVRAKRLPRIMKWCFARILARMRHEAACRWLSRGLDPRAIQLLLGHADLKTTQRYLNVTDEELRALLSCGRIRLWAPVDPLVRCETG